MPAVIGCSWRQHQKVGYNIIMYHVDFARFVFLSLRYSLKLSQAVASLTTRALSRAISALSQGVFVWARFAH